MTTTLPTTLPYADPTEQPALPVRWALNGLLVFAVATFAERLCIWLMLLTILGDHGRLDLGGRDVVDHVLPPLAAVALLSVVWRERRSPTPRLTRPIAALCALPVLLAVASVVYWSLTVLPRVWTGRGGMPDGVIWEAELIHVRLLPVAWPAMVSVIAVRGLPRARTAAATLTIWALATWALAAFATAALWQGRGLRAFSTELHGYTVAGAWTFMLVPILAVAVMLWLDLVPARARRPFCIAAWLFWLGAAMLRAWHDERLVSVRDAQFAMLARLDNGSAVLAELISDLILWQIAPFVLLLLLLARPRHSVH